VRNSETDPSVDVDRRRARRQRRVVAGLLLTFVGLFLLVYLLPVAPGALALALPVAAAGALALWVGGILMGVGMGERRRRARR
jgi:hypothetical protein